MTCFSDWAINTGGPDLVFGAMMTIAFLHANKLMASSATARDTLIDWRHYFFVQALAGWSAGAFDHVFALFKCQSGWTPPPVIQIITTHVAHTSSSMANCSLGIAFLNPKLSTLKWIALVLGGVLSGDLIVYIFDLGRYLPPGPDLPAFIYIEFNGGLVSFSLLTIALVLRRTNIVMIVPVAIALTFPTNSDAAVHWMMATYTFCFYLASLTLVLEKPIWPHARESLSTGKGLL